MAFTRFGYREAGGDRGFGQIDRPCQGDDLRHRHLNLGTGLGPCANTGPSANTGLGLGSRPGLGFARHLPRSRGQPLGTNEQVDDIASSQVQIGPVRYPAITTSSIRARTVLASAANISVSAVGGSAPAITNSIAIGPPVTATPTHVLLPIVPTGTLGSVRRWQAGPVGPYESGRDRRLRRTRRPSTAVRLLVFRRVREAEQPPSP
ncbi:hypothetical protein [Microtetraspora malaysiensis]|uniref:hypothetical protein n=1 Tax=Microtetraspora malaysiensis TaxID=161358 RepID=UPI001470B328|nr:hypothetical protein [Microtetraspora malaysiensis]